MAHNFRPSNNKRQRRGIGAIIGGIILMTILVTSVLIYYVGILSADKVKESYDIQSAQSSQNKAAEQLDASRSVFKNATATYIRANMTNNGPNTLAVAYSLLYCTEGATCAADPESVKTFIALNPGTNSITDMGPVTRGYTYRMDLITERGNVIATTECQVDVTQDVCRNDPGYINPDFTISAFPNSVVVSPGGSGTSKISVASLGGYSGSVDLSVSGMPPGSGITANPSPTTVSVTSGGTSSYDLTLGSASTTAPNTYTLTVTGTDTAKSITHTTSIALTVLGTAPDFTIAANPNSVVVQAGNSGSSEIDLTSLNAYTGTVALTSSGAPPGSGISPTLSPSSVLVPSAGTAPSNLVINTIATTPPATYKLTITGTDAAKSITHTTSVSLTVLPASAPPDFTLSAFPNTMVINGGGIDSTQITVNSLNGFSSDVTLSVSPAYPGITASSPGPNPATLASGYTSTITFTTQTTAAPGNYVYTVTGTGGGLTRTTQVRVTILGAVSSENIQLDVGLILQPQIQGIFPNPHGSTGSSSTKAGLWGAVVANPTDFPMQVRRVIATAFVPYGTNPAAFPSPCAITNVKPSSGGSWTCPSQNTLQWSGTWIIPPHSAQEFLVTVQKPSSNNDFPSYAVNFNVFTDFGQFAKAGYSGSMTKGISEIANVYLSTTTASTATSTMIGTLGVNSGQTLKVNATIAQLGDSCATCVIKNNTKLIIDIPKGFTNVVLTTNPPNYPPGSPAPFYTCTQSVFAGQTQISCPVRGDMTSGSARSVQFTMIAPIVQGLKLYTLFVLADGYGGDGSGTACNISTGANCWPVGPVAENVIQVSGPSITINPTSGSSASSQTVTVTGTLFAPSSTMIIKYDGNVMTTTPATCTTNGSGSFSCTITVPAGPAGSHTIQATDSSLNSAIATYTKT